MANWICINNVDNTSAMVVPGGMLIRTETTRITGDVSVVFVPCREAEARAWIKQEEESRHG